MVIWPLGIAKWIDNLFKEKPQDLMIGEVIQTDWPNIIHVELKENSTWEFNSNHWSKEILKLFIEANGNKKVLIPLYKQFQRDKLIGTGLYQDIYYEQEKNKIKGFQKGCIYDNPIDITKENLINRLGGEENSTLIGFINENSTINEISFQVINSKKCKFASLVWCLNEDKEKIYYQISNGMTSEESFNKNRFGYHQAKANQLGIISNDEQKSYQLFDEYPWLPEINTPVFIEDNTFGKDIKLLDESTDFEYGDLPNTQIKVGGNFVDNMTHHTAILGITGSGKNRIIIGYYSRYYRERP